jgi:GntR family transcriptional regulator
VAETRDLCLTSTASHPQSTTPVYRQIVEQICRPIDAGVYRPGEALPSHRTLPLELCINPNTVQRAFDELLRTSV